MISVMFSPINVVKVLKCSRNLGSLFRLRPAGHIRQGYEEIVRLHQHRYGRRGLQMTFTIDRSQTCPSEVTDPRKVQVWDSLVSILMQEPSRRD